MFRKNDRILSEKGGGHGRRLVAWQGTEGLGRLLKMRRGIVTSITRGNSRSDLRNQKITGTLQHVAEL